MTTIENWIEFRNRNAGKYAEFEAWLDELIALGANYSYFASAQYTHRQLKVVRRELRKVSLS